MKTIVRETKETRVEIAMGRSGGTDARVPPRVDTGEPFLDHMLTAFAFYAGLDLTLKATGDLRHHLVEDVAITVGEAIARLVPPQANRYGARTLPMDDALVQVAVDLGGRPYYEGPLPAKLYDHWMRSFAMQARATLHVKVERGTDRHHVVEAAFKALGLAVREALGESGALFSTKGAVKWEDGAC
jgi:imidazoleglycerol-phosphate dehydratase